MICAKDVALFNSEAQSLFSLSESSKLLKRGRMHRFCCTKCFQMLSIPDPEQTPNADVDQGIDHPCESPPKRHSLAIGISLCAQSSAGWRVGNCLCSACASRHALFRPSLARCIWRRGLMVRTNMILAPGKPPIMQNRITVFV